jgi:hypothetical protein
MHSRRKKLVQVVTTSAFYLRTEPGILAITISDGN